MSSYSDLFNETSFQGDRAIVETLQVNASALFPYMSNSLVGVDVSGNLVSMPLTTGQLFVGRTGNTPLATVLAGTTNQVIITSAPGTITLSLPQDIATSSTPTWRSATLNGAGVSVYLNLSTTGGGSAITHADGVGGTFRDTVGGGFIRVTAGVSTNQNTLDNGSGTMTVKQLIDAGLTATTMVSCNGSKQLQSTTLASANGITLAFAGSTLTASASQNLATTGTPTFAQLIDSGLTATTMVSCSASKQLQSTTLANSNGCNASFTASTLTFSMTQDLAATASPSFVKPYLTGIPAGGLVGTNPLTKQVYGFTGELLGDVVMWKAIVGTPYSQWINGSLAIGTSLTRTVDEYAPSITFDTIQDIRKTATPTFAGLTTGVTGAMLSASATGRLQATTITNTNGCNTSFSGATMTCSMTQDLTTAGSPTFAGMSLPSFPTNSLVGINLGGALMPIGIRTNNGMSVSVGDALSIDTPQDIRTTAYPTFRNVITTNSVNFVGTSSTVCNIGTFTTPTYTTAILRDPAGMYNPANARFTVPTTGCYDITCSIRIQDGAVAPGSDTTGLSFNVNGAQKGAMWSMPDSNGRRSTTLQQNLELTAGDYVQVVMYQNSAANLQAQVMSLSMRQVA